MFCASCGTSNPDHANFCMACGRARAASINSRRAVFRRWLPLIVSMAAAGLAVFGYWAFSGSQSKNSPSTTITDGATQERAKVPIDTHPSEAPIQSPKADKNQAPIPTRVDVLLHPYDLVQDPFTYKGKQVHLDVWSQPVFLNGRIFNYLRLNENSALQGSTGLRLLKRLSEDQWLYDISGLDADAGYSATSPGQLVVAVPEEQPKPLALDRDWEIEPLGLVQGTNAFGGTVSVPLVRFLGYSTAGQLSPQQEDQIRANGNPICVYCSNHEFLGAVLQAELHGSEDSKGVQVTLTILVLPDGTVGPDVKVTKSSNDAFNKIAIETVRSWRFKSATDKDGHPIASALSVEVSDSVP